MRKVYSLTSLRLIILHTSLKINNRPDPDLNKFLFIDSLKCIWPSTHRIKHQVFSGSDTVTLDVCGCVTAVFWLRSFTDPVLSSFLFSLLWWCGWYDNDDGLSVSLHPSRCVGVLLFDCFLSEASLARYWNWPLTRNSPNLGGSHLLLSGIPCW